MDNKMEESEIEKLAIEYCKSIKNTCEDGDVFSGFVAGYTKCKENNSDNKYSEEDLREAIKKAKKYFPEFPYGLKEGHQVRFSYTSDEIVESLNEKKSNENS